MVTKKYEMILVGLLVSLLLGACQSERANGSVPVPTSVPLTATNTYSQAEVEANLFPLVAEEEESTAEPEALSENEPVSDVDEVLNEEGVNYEAELLLTPTVPQPDVLPYGVYFIKADDGQVWYMARDGVTLTQWTFEDVPVSLLSPDGEMIVYIKDEVLYLKQLSSGKHMVLAEGNPDATDADEKINGLAWSPDGSQVVYGLLGIHSFNLTTLETTLVLANDPKPELDNPDYVFPPEMPLLRMPVSFSPDGSKLLYSEAPYYSHGSAYSVYDFASGMSIDLEPPGGGFCCNLQWSADGSSILISGTDYGLTASGIWKLDAATGAAVPVIDGDPSGDGNMLNLGSYANQLDDGKVYFFANPIQTWEDGVQPFYMARIDADATNRERLREDAYHIRGALWDPAGSGALIVDMTSQYADGGQPEWPYRGELVWLPADGSEAVPLGIIGRAFRWDVE